MKRWRDVLIDGDMQYVCGAKYSRYHNFGHFDQIQIQITCAESKIPKTHLFTPWSPTTILMTCSRVQRWRLCLSLWLPYNIRLFKPFYCRRNLKQPLLAKHPVASAKLNESPSIWMLSGHLYLPKPWHRVVHLLLQSLWERYHVFKPSYLFKVSGSSLIMY